MAKRKSGPKSASRGKAAAEEAESSCSADADREATAFHKRTGRIIKLLTVQEILDEEWVQKM
ncbi:MAG: hypothetical protein IT430_12595 [Phycisphaerales bacterium]|nr:hypothetical protein [Phycisphaerales bacterium]